MGLGKTSPMGLLLRAERSGRTLPSIDQALSMRAETPAPLAGLRDCYRPYRAMAAGRRCLADPWAQHVCLIDRVGLQGAERMRLVPVRSSRRSARGHENGIGLSCRY